MTFILKENLRNTLHKNLIEILYKARAGHIGSSLSCLDIITEVFYNQMHRNDKFVLSKGHGVPALYVVLNKLGLISDRQLSSFHTDGTSLPAHPPSGLGSSIPFPSGSLGHGFSISIGIAQGLTYQNKKGVIPRVFCLMSDGECNEGQVWEAAQYASAKKIDNLILMIDKNNLQAFGKTKDVLGESASPNKWKAFGFEVYKCSGHKPKEMKKTFSEVKKSKSKKPKVIIFNTIKGHGVKYMENRLEWHYNTLDENLYNKAIKSIDKRIK